MAVPAPLEARSGDGWTESLQRHRSGLDSSGGSFAVNVASAPPSEPSLFARLSSHSVRVDLVVACLLGLLGFTVGSSYMRTFNRMGGLGDFGQPEFSAAVALACGRGYGNLGYAA